MRAFLRSPDPVPILPQSLTRAIARCLTHQNGPVASPYTLTFDRPDRSGACLGQYQSDCAIQPEALDCLTRIMHAAHLPPAQIQRIGDILRHGARRNPLSPSDTRAVVAAVGASSGRALVDQLDRRILETVLRHVTRVIGHGHKTGHHLSDEAVLYGALWVHLVASPTLLCRWLNTGTGDAPASRGFGRISVPGSQASPPVVVTGSMVRDYLKTTHYIRERPENLDGFIAAVDAARATLDQSCVAA